MTVEAFLIRARLRAVFAALRREREPQPLTEMPRAELRQEHRDSEGRRLADITPCRDLLTDLAGRSKP